MSLIQSGVDATLATVNPTQKGLRVSEYPNEALGYYHSTMASGLLTVVAAGTATAGHVFAFRNGGANLAIVTRLQVQLQVITDFTATQEIQLAGYRATGYSASHTGGTGYTAADSKRRTTAPTPTISDLRVGTTAGLTAGTHTLATDKFMGGSATPLAAGATVQKVRIDNLWVPPERHPQVYGTNEGFIIRNEILWGAAGTGRLIVDIDWFEVASW